MVIRIQIMRIIININGRIVHRLGLTALFVLSYVLNRFLMNYRFSSFVY